MKKTLFAIGVSVAVLCSTLAYAAHGQGTPALLKKAGEFIEKALPDSKADKKPEAAKPRRGMQLDPESVRLATSRMPQATGRTAMKAAASREANVQEVVVDLWGTAENIQAVLSDSATYEAETNTMSFWRSDASPHKTFTSLDEDGNYGWHVVDGQTYQFTGTLSAAEEAVVSPCIVYYNGSNLYVRSSETVTLNEANGFTADFNVSASGIQDGYAIMVAFLVDTSYPKTLITSTNNRFFYSYTTLLSEEWTEDKNLPGLGLADLDSYYDKYIVTLEDGVTTLGLVDDGWLFVTGINTTASEVVLPKYVTINGEAKRINYFGHPESLMDWSGAPALTSLDARSVVNNFFSSFEGSAITDLYISQGVYFDNVSGNADMYLHIPYGASRYDYTYSGFKRVLVGGEQLDYPETTTSDWVIAGEEEGVYFGITLFNGRYAIKEIFTDKESVMLPIGTPADGGLYYIRQFGADYNYENCLCQHAPALKSVTIPETYTNLLVYWSGTPIKELHLQGDVPSTNWSLGSDMTVYVSDRSYFANYESNSSWSNAAIEPDGWNFEWMTVNVGRKGEFAQTYIEMTDADWSLGTYVKVTGTLNTTDLQNIKQLTNLRKLDLSEAEFTELPSSFLNQKSTLREVTLPDNLEAISREAFSYCGKLTAVHASGVRSVGNNSFYNCGKLVDFDLSKVKTVGSCAFENCSKFNPTDMSSLTTIDSEAFENTAVEEVVIPEGVRTISPHAFRNCSRLTRVVLPLTVTTIGYYAFESCTALASINLPEGITSIEQYAFEGCRSLGEITLPSTLQSIGYRVLDDCSSLATVKCKAIVPPVTDGNFTDGMDLTHCTLYVAPFAVDAYRDANNWNAFYIMKPLDEPVKNIYINRPMTFDLQSQDNAVLQENPNMTLDYNNSGYNTSVGQLSASGDGTLSAGVFEIHHQFTRRSYNYGNDYRTTLVNNAENMRADSVLCSINLEKNYWHFISFQYDVQVSDIIGLNNTDFVIRQYNGEQRATGDGSASNWEDVPADGVLKAGKGYIIQAANNSVSENGSQNSAVVLFPSRNTVTKNNLFTSNNIIVPLDEYPAEFAHNRSWNLVGNPYPCYYDMRYLMDDFTTPIVLWRGTSYQAYSPVDDGIILRPNESFFVQRPLDAEQMVFGAEGRMHYTAARDSNFTPGVACAPAERTFGVARHIFNFNIEGCGSDDRARIVMNEEASLDYEINRDASKFFAEMPAGVEIFVDGGVRYDICERPFDNGSATLGVRAAVAGEYTLTLKGRNTEGWSVTLTDTETGIVTDLCADNYTFDAKAGMAAGRFVVTFKAPVQTDINDVDAAVDANANVRIVSLAGVTVFEGKLGDFKASAPATGVYVVVAAGKSYKIVVK